MSVLADNLQLGLSTALLGQRESVSGVQTYSAAVLEAVMANELTVGTRRIGNLFDFNPDTPDVNVTLERTEDAITVTVPWSEPDSPYARWFVPDGESVRVTSGPGSPQAPRRVHFHDSHGSVLLIRCRADGFHSDAFGPGSGTLWARAAILGVDDDVEFDRPHALQTEISGLRAWLGVTSWEQTRDWSDDSRTVSFTSRNTPAIAVGQYKRVTLSFRPSWRVVPGEGPNGWVLVDLLRVVTRSNEPLGWDEHLQIHRAARDLLVLSRWHPESCVEVLALREDDRVLTIGGKEHGAQWRTVVINDDEPTAPPRGYRAHLICYNELQAAGILRWLVLRDEFARALDPVISSIGLRNATAETLLAHTGPGLEALGYLLMLRDGVAERAAANARLKDRFERILKDVGDSLPFDGSAWVTRTADVYNGLKHANRAAPDPLDVLNAWRESVIVVRAWVAVELGIPIEDVKQRLAEDPQRFAYVKVE